MANLTGDAKPAAVDFSSDGLLEVFPGNGDGTFQLAKTTQYPTTYTIVRYLGGLDVDGNGILDPLGWSNYSGVTAWLGAADTSFNVKSISGAEFRSLVAGDFDGNNKPDFAVQDISNSGILVYLNVSQGCLRRGIPGQLPKTRVSSESRLIGRCRSR